MIDLLNEYLQPQALFIGFAAIAAFATVLTFVLPALDRERVQGRMKVMAIERDKMRSQRLAELSDHEGKGRLRSQPKGFMQQVVQRLNVQKILDSQDLRLKLRMAGMRGEAPVVAYIFFRVTLPIVLFAVAIFYLFVLRVADIPPLFKLAGSLVAAFAGFYLPNIFLSNLTQKRQESIKVAIPDALDLLLICVQAGMSIEAAFSKVANEISSQSIVLAEEMSLTTAELSYLPERRQAYENLGIRTGVAGVKAVATSLIQAERYGTPVSQALRVMAKENRQMRMSEAERKAAALPPKLTVPMIVFFLPVLFIIILGPAAIQIMKM